MSSFTKAQKRHLARSKARFNRRNATTVTICGIDFPSVLRVQGKQVIDGKEIIVFSTLKVVDAGIEPSSKPVEKKKLVCSPSYFRENFRRLAYEYLETRFPKLHELAAHEWELLSAEQRLPYEEKDRLDLEHPKVKEDSESEVEEETSKVDGEKALEVEEEVEAPKY